MEKKNIHVFLFFSCAVATFFDPILLDGPRHSLCVCVCLFHFSTLYSFHRVRHCSWMCAYAIFVLTHWRVFFHSLVYPLIPSNVDLIHLFGPKIYCPPLGIVFVILITSSSWSCDFLSPFSVPKKKNTPIN